MNNAEHLHSIIHLCIVAKNVFMLGTIEAKFDFLGNQRSTNDVMLINFTLRKFHQSHDRFPT